MIWFKFCAMFFKGEIMKIKSLNGPMIEVELNFLCIRSVKMPISFPGAMLAVISSTI